MSALSVSKEACLEASAPYARHRPEQTLLYQLIKRHYSDFLSTLEVQGQSLPKYVR